MKIGFLTSEDWPDCTPDDLLVLPYLAQRGIEVNPVIWTQSLPSDIDVFIMRSCWNYYQSLGPFQSFLKQIDSQSRALANPLNTMLQNCSKDYLLELQVQGWPMLETHLIKSEETFELDAFWNEHPILIVKPLVSASGNSTYCLKYGEDIPQALKLAHQRCGVLIQPFLNEIQSQGEISMIFFNGQFSHALQKLPAQNHFLVQEEHGGVTRLTQAPPDFLKLTQSLCDTLYSDCLYVRIDGIRSNQGWKIMELELLEPSLYLSQDLGAPGRWGQAILNWLKRHT